MSMTQMEYAETKEMLEEVQRQPAEIRREILTMLRGAIVISDMYGRVDWEHLTAQAPAERDSA